MVMSGHKFVGGPGTPGVLIVKKRLVTNRLCVCACNLLLSCFEMLSALQAEAPIDKDFSLPSIHSFSTRYHFVQGGGQYFMSRQKIIITLAIEKKGMR